MKNTTELHRRRSLGLTDYPVNRNRHIEDPRPLRYLLIALLCMAIVTAILLVAPVVNH
jgi:hypothetical protein